jgi:hypothetical protein
MPTSREELFGCDTLVATGTGTADRGVIFAKNSDRLPDECQPLRVYPPREWELREAADYRPSLQHGKSIASEKTLVLRQAAGDSNRDGWRGLTTVNAGRLRQVLSLT